MFVEIGVIFALLAEYSTAMRVCRYIAGGNNCRLRVQNEDEGEGRPPCDAETVMIARVGDKNMHARAASLGSQRRMCGTICLADWKSINKGGRAT